MTLVYLLLALIGLPVVILGLSADRAAGRGPAIAGSVLLRSTAAFLVFGGLAGFALSLLSLHPLLVAVTAVLMGSGGAWLRAEVLRLSSGPPVPVPAAAVEGGIGVVVEAVGGEEPGQVVVEAGRERWYLAARPFRRGASYPEGAEVVIVSVAEGIALVAARDEVGR